MRSWFTIFSFISFGGLFSQHEFPSENITSLLNTKTHSYRVYKHRTDLKDSITQPEFLYSLTKISQSKKSSIFKTVIFDPNNSMRIIQEWEDRYDRTHRLIREYDKNGRLITETDYWVEKYSNGYDTIKYFYNEKGNLIHSVKTNNLNNWARDSFFYENDQLIKKVHRIPIDSTPSITFEEEFETYYYYKNGLLERKLMTHHYTESITIDSLFYEDGVLVQLISFECEAGENWHNKIEYRFNKEGIVTGMVFFTYPNTKLTEVVESFDSMGRKTSSVVIQYGSNNKFIQRYVYE